MVGAQSVVAVHLVLMFTGQVELIQRRLDRLSVDLQIFGKRGLFQHDFFVGICRQLYGLFQALAANGCKLHTVVARREFDIKILLCRNLDLIVEGMILHALQNHCGSHALFSVCYRTGEADLAALFKFEDYILAAPDIFNAKLTLLCIAPHIIQHFLVIYQHRGKLVTGFCHEGHSIAFTGNQGILICRYHSAGTFHRCVNEINASFIQVGR